MKTLAHALAFIYLIQMLSAYRCAADEKTEVHLRLSGSEETVFAELQEMIADSRNHSVQSLTITHTQLTDRVGSLVARFPSLQTLKIGGGAGSLETFVDVGFYRHLSQLRTLRSLRLIECVDRPYGDSVVTSIAFVENLSALEHLELDLSVTEQDLSRIVHLPNLESIVFERKPTGSSEERWYKLVHKSSLQKLVIGDFPEDLSIHNVFANPSDISIKELSVLRIHRSRIWSGKDVEVLAAIKGLASLQIGTINARDITLLTPLKHLTDLDVRTKGNVNRIQVVRSSQRLRKLTVVCDLFDAHSDLANHPSLSEVTIGERSKMAGTDESMGKQEKGKRVVNRKPTGAEETNEAID